METDRFAIVELFGHQKIAGKISDESVGGASFVRIDVPALEGVPTFTKLFGPSAIYAITFVVEEVANAAAAAYRLQPISAYDIPELRALRSQTAITYDPDDEPVF